jgi:hypothetical protein
MPEWVKSATEKQLYFGRAIAEHYVMLLHSLQLTMVSTEVIL